MFFCALTTAAALLAQPAPIHSVTDISHDFSFYFDGRFGGQYLSPETGDKDARNWGTLSKCDFAETNLLIVQSAPTPCDYPASDIAKVRALLEEGGGVVVFGSYGRFRDEPGYRLNDLCRAFGAEFAEEPLTAPLKADAALGVSDLTFYGGTAIRLIDPDGWKVLVADSAGRVALARKRVGRGSLLICSRGLCGRQPDAKDPINSSMWKPLLRSLTAGKKVDPARDPSGAPLDVTNKPGLTVKYNAYLAGEADTIFDIYSKVRPVLEEVLGVPPSEGMLTSLILLATGGGGFSSGTEIGIGVWWGDFPKERYGMVELLSHESTHSWVLPFAEPMWNEGIATYAGIVVGQRMGLPAADTTLAGWIAGARKYDPEMNKLDIAHGTDIPHAVAMAKPMWIFEQLRKENPNLLADYFRAKRRLVDPAKRKAYSAEDSVAVLSTAMGRNLFPWFQSLGVTVDQSKTDLPVP